MRVSIIVELRQPGIPAAIGVSSLEVGEPLDHRKLHARFSVAIGKALRQFQEIRAEQFELRKKQQELPLVP